MKKIKFFGIVLVALFAITSLSSCCSATHAVAISPNQAIGSKVGTSSQITLFGTIGIGGPRQSIKKAAEDSGITYITHVEENNKSYVLGIVARHTIRVYGE